MARSVVLHPTVRCPACRMPPRWCICPGLDTVETPLRVDVLMDHLEQWRPTSTGLLVGRVVRGARVHPFKRGAALDPAAVRDPDRELWVLHPRGEPLPAGAAPERTQVLLLDGSWQAVGVMIDRIGGWGRRVRLPVDGGPSRYRLRVQPADGRLSTAEALIAVLRAFGLQETATRLNLQFELHVFAGLLARGKRAEALRHLEDSPVRTALPELVARLLDGA